ncbi:MAG: hypothetical protein ACI9UN_005323 [Granulosicoccus sp.]
MSAAKSFYNKSESLCEDALEILQEILHYDSTSYSDGEKNWMFSWTELGAEHVGIIQSLICTCKLHGIDPYVYLTDVLQRVGVHPAKDVAQLTPRLWKEHFAADPMQSDLMLEI